MSRIIVETMSHIDVNELNRLGAFARPMQFPFMGLRTSSQVIEYRSPRSPKDQPSQRIPIQWTRCTYGGATPWLICLCGKRVGKLYYGSAWLGCRHCGKMVYASQSKGHRGRLHLKATRMRARLGDDGRPGIDALPHRPRRMHRKTYPRLRAKIALIESKLIEGRMYRPRPRKERWNYASRA
jgi:hypothetical protein